jgi:hypothetical protein
MGNEAPWCCHFLDRHRRHCGGSHDGISEWSVAFPCSSRVRNSQSLIVHQLAFWFTPTWVKIAADAYAEKLLASCESL